MIEEWKEIKDYPNYMVSNLGKVKSTDRYINCRGGKKRFVSGKQLKLLYNKRTGYIYVGLNDSCFKKVKTVHRLVAETFLPNPNNLPQVNHKDENPLNNCVDNLEWCDCKYNINYGTHNLKNGKAHQKKVQQYTTDGILINEWDSIKEASESLNTELKCFRDLKNKHKNFIWKYA